MTTIRFENSLCFARLVRGTLPGWLWVAGRLIGVGLGQLAAAEAVIISEFVASNVGGLLDEDQASSDWIELYNSGNSSVNLSGWYLTDNTNNLNSNNSPYFYSYSKRPRP